MSTAPKRQLHALNALKVIAILLVFNSHCGDLYPIKAMATGGALGNSLFFILSGYLLKIRDEDRLFPWIGRRILQLYPGMVIVSVINIAVGQQVVPGTLELFVRRFIFPTAFWFVGGLLAFNVLAFFFERSGLFDRFALFTCAIWATYAICYIFFIDKTAWHVEDHGYFRCIYYFFIYSMGYLIKTGRVRLELDNRALFCCAVAGFAGNIGWKGLLVRFPPFMVTQFVTQLFCVLFAVALLLYGLSVEEAYNQGVPAKLRGGIDFWSRYSLEIYFTQRLAQWIAVPIAFPLNLALAVALTLPYALVLKRATGKVSDAIMGHLR